MAVGSSWMRRSGHTRLRSSKIVGYRINFLVPEADMPDTAAIAPARLAATILLLRDDPAAVEAKIEAQMEVFMVVRHQQIDFASGALVFPGGKLAAGDSDSRLAQLCSGADDLSTEQLALRVAAIREAFEESGVLLARKRGAAKLIGAEVLDALDHYRKPLDKGAIGIVEMLESEGLELACEALVPFAHWVTPTFMPKRFDTYFFLAVAPSEQVAGHDGREMVDSVWLRPAAVIAEAAAGTRTLVPATLLNVEKLGEQTTVAGALAAARKQPPVMVLPEVVEQADGAEGKRTLRIPGNAGYKVTEFTF